MPKIKHKDKIAVKKLIAIAEKMSEIESSDSTLGTHLKENATIIENYERSL